MTSTTREEAIRQVADIKRRLEQMLVEPPFGHGGNETRDEARADDKARIALRHAADWLGDIVQPLTEEETKKWEECAEIYCEDMNADMDAVDYEAGMNDADRRAAIEFIGDEQ